MTEIVDYEEALRTFARRFRPGTEPEIIEQQFHTWWSHGALEFSRAEDGTLQVRLASARVRR